MSTANVFKEISHFQVHEFSSLLSDAHCPVSLTLSLDSMLKHSYKESHENKEIPVLWQSEKCESFIENFDILKVSEIECKLDNLIETNCITIENVNEIVNNINNLYESCACETFGLKNKPQKDKYSNFKPWFNRKCINARNLYHKTRKMYNKYKTNYYKNLLKIVSKNYKRTLYTQNKIFKANRVEKLRRLKTNNPKEYWKIINSDKKNEDSQASLEDLFNFYQHMNEKNTNDDDDDNDGDDDNENGDGKNMDDNDLQNLVNEEINQPITYEELSKAIKALKNNKSPGLDNIVNEQLKSTFNIMHPLFIKLFNVILDKGIVPETWTVGNIKPIFKNKGNPKDPENYRPITLLSNFGKLFTSIINNQLNNFAEICEAQSGFRKNFSTADNIFILKCLIDIVQSQRKKPYCCFIDFKQAFDTVWRTGLWKKNT